VRPSTIKWNSWVLEVSVIWQSPLKLNWKVPDFLTVKIPVSRSKTPYSFFVSISNEAKANDLYLLAVGFVHSKTEKTGSETVLFLLVSTWTWACKSEKRESRISMRLLIKSNMLYTTKFTLWFAKRNLWRCTENKINIKLHVYIWILNGYCNYFCYHQQLEAVELHL